ncbi:MAG: type IV pilin protein [Methylococcales bacterium]
MLLSTHRSSSGFTFLEMLIAVVIVGILAAISLPSFQNSIITGRRADAKGELLRLAQEEAKWRLSHTTYSNDLDDFGGAAANNDYNFAVTTNAPTIPSTFTITATPTSTNGQDQDACGTLSISVDANIVSDDTSACPKP